MTPDHPHGGDRTGGHQLVSFSMATLILLRHGERAWNSGNLCALAAVGSSNGADRARRAGELLHRHGIRPDVARTSILHRTIETARLALAAAGVPDVPTHRSWRLNERHYGALQGLDKAATEGIAIVAAQGGASVTAARGSVTPARGGASVTVAPLPA
jgi:bisphosphoglycerate-dependent phosphoglycerate mutase family 1